MQKAPVKRRESIASTLKEQKIETVDSKEIFKLQTEKLKKLLTIEPNHRDEYMLSEIASIVKQIGFLSNYKDRPFFTDLCKHLYVKSLEPNSVIFKQGDEGDKFYVILTGGVRVLIDQATTLKDVMIKTEVAQLKKGDFFGEMALQYKFKRTATIITTEQTDLIILENEAFQQFMQADSMQTERVKETKQFLEELEIFKGFSDKIMVRLSTKCIQSKHEHQTILLKAGTVPQKIFIIKKGVVRVIQKIPGMKSDYQPQIEYGFISDEYFELSELRKGEVFGDLEMLKQEKSKYTYMTEIKSEIITLSLFDIKQIVPSELLDQYLVKLQSYPDQQDLKEMILEKRKWEKYKKSLLNHVKQEKQSRKGFNQGLRLPTINNDSQITPPNRCDVKAFVISDKRQRLTPVERRLYFNEMNQLKISISNERLKKFLINSQ